MSTHSATTRSLAQWAADAVSHVESACNLSGLVYAFERCVHDLVSSQNYEGTHSLDHHPICVVWADKMDDLSRSRGMSPISSNECLVSLVSKFARSMRDVCSEALHRGEGTDWRNQHPDVQEHVRRIVYVTGSREPGRLLEAISTCRQLAYRG